MKFEASVVGSTEPIQPVDFARMYATLWLSKSRPGKSIGAMLSADSEGGRRYFFGRERNGGEGWVIV